MGQTACTSERKKAHEVLAVKLKLDKELLSSVTLFEEFCQEKFKQIAGYNFQDVFGKRLAELSLNSSEYIAWVMRHKCTWIKYYKYFMVYITYRVMQTGLMYDSEEYRMIMLCTPYEIAQIWRTHITYSKQYEEFCKLLTDGVGLIEFEPMKLFFFGTSRTIDAQAKEMKKVYTTMMFHMYALMRDELSIDEKKKCVKDRNKIWGNLNESLAKNMTFVGIDAKTIFPKFDKNVKNKSQYKERINDAKVALHEVAKNEKTTPSKLVESSLAFLNQVRDIGDVKEIHPDEIYNLIETPPSNWELKDPIKKKKLKKLCESFELPKSFISILMVECLYSMEEAMTIINDYRKFLFISASSKTEEYTPSEEVDNAWKLHMHFTQSYNTVSQKIFKGFKHHDPLKNNQTEDKNLKKLYNMSKYALHQKFGFVNERIWPMEDTRYKQVVKWYDYKKIAATLNKIYTGGGGVVEVITQ